MAANQPTKNVKFTEECVMEKIVLNKKSLQLCHYDPES